MADKKFGCPACGYTNDNEEDVKNHLIEMADDPKHQEFDLKRQEEVRGMSGEQEET